MKNTQFSLNHKELEMNMCIINTIATDVLVLKHQAISINNVELEQLERLHSEDTPPPPPPPPTHTHTPHLMITHTIESYWIPSQKKTKWKLQI